MIRNLSRSYHTQTLMDPRLCIHICGNNESNKFHVYLKNTSPTEMGVKIKNNTNQTVTHDRHYSQIQSLSIAKFIVDFNIITFRQVITSLFMKPWSLAPNQAPPYLANHKRSNNKIKQLLIRNKCKNIYAVQECCIITRWSSRTCHKVPMRKIYSFYCSTKNEL